jgi:hypothetical protein
VELDFVSVLERLFITITYIYSTLYTHAKIPLNLSICQNFFKLHLFYDFLIYFCLHISNKKKYFEESSQKHDMRNIWEVRYLHHILIQIPFDPNGHRLMWMTAIECNRDVVLFYYIMCLLLSTFRPILLLLIVAMQLNSQMRSSRKMT